MSIKSKNAGAYADIVGVFHKRAGAYEAVQGVYAKAGGVYGRVDAPASVYATWNPLDKSTNIALSDADLTATATDTSWKSARANISHSSGKHYFEISVNAGLAVVGLADAVAGLPSTFVGGASKSVGIRTETGEHLSAGVTVTGINPGGGVDTYCFAVDATEGKAWVRKGGGAWARGNPINGTDPSWSWAAATAIFPAASVYDTGATVSANFGHSTFAHAVPEGFTAGWGE